MGFEFLNSKHVLKWGDVEHVPTLMDFEVFRIAPRWNRPRIFSINKSQLISPMYLESSSFLNKILNIIINHQTSYGRTNIIIVVVVIIIIIIIINLYPKIS